MDNSDKINITITFGMFKELLNCDSERFFELMRPVVWQKAEKLVKRELYSRYKAAETPEERQAIRDKLNALATRNPV